MTAPDHASRDHARLSPSSSHRFLGAYPTYQGCTAAPGLEAEFPDTSSTAAAEGTLCHEFCEVKVRNYFYPMEMTNRKLNNVLKKLREEELYDKEMEDCSDEYLEYIKDKAMEYDANPFVAIEQRLDISAYLPECFGTGDCIMICGNDLRVIDYKHGKGVPVSAEHNTQLMLYALGAYAIYGLLYPIKTIKLTIFQPRINNTNEWQCTKDELLAFGELVKAKVDEINNNPTFRPGEEACRFCKARQTCRARAENNLKLAGFVGQKPPTISADEVGKYLIEGKDIVSWLSDLEEWALKECLSGNEVPGWKAVHGRANRRWTDQEEAFKVLKEKGYDEAVLYERKPITLTATEKLVGKKEFTAMLGKYVEKPEGAPVLVVESDKREAIKPVNANDVFK